ncbi:hypothetical protein SAMN05443665_102264 [Actinomadura meyerae]|uniref:Secreted protein n=1 Tax=Actinomadura meyerae TaxID=240840 RepID=A0A239LE90_9ACTN|nr:hypothetical protein [Actinomadura meyerae]SNT28966.1 hypothetical protein SAMN05443665_102264 [Actinomadura meyerae]
MSTAIWVVIAVIAVAAVVAAVHLARTRSRTRRLKGRFGPEYDRAVRDAGGRSAAERELLSRERRHEELELRELDPGKREQYHEQWVRVQERFVDTPAAAVEQADGLVTIVMGERGYPTQGFEDKAAHLSVEHGRTLEHYRRAHAISGKAASNEASTEDLRQAMVHYRALFEELLAAPGHGRTGHAPADHARDGHAADHERTGHERTGHERVGRHAAGGPAPEAQTPTTRTPRS